MGGNMYLISGSNLNGTFQGAIEVPPNSEAGTWTVTDVTAVDNAGNSAIYYTSQLQTMGFSDQLASDLHSGYDAAGFDRFHVQPVGCECGDGRGNSHGDGASHG